MSKATRKVVVGSRIGLHADAAIHFVEAARATGLHVTITNVDGEKGDADSLISVLEAPVGHGQEVVLEVEGDNAEPVADELAKLLASHV
jgi:phosphocarrier protein